MVLFSIIIGIGVISLLLSYYSVKKDMEKQKHVEEVQKSLAKERVIFYPGKK